MDKHYLISVIVPVYNVEDYLKKCIESIISQQYTNLQIILIDDGSTDSSGEICDEYALTDKRIDVIHKKNEGVVSARKAGLDRARGEYIGFVDADDYIDSEFYYDLLKDITESDADFVHAGYMIENNVSKKVCNRFIKGVYDISGKQADFINTYILKIDSDLHMQYGVVSKLFKSDLVKKCHSAIPDSLTRGEDMLCTCMCILDSKRVFLDTRANYHYIMRNDSATHCNDIEEIIIFGYLYKCFIDCFNEHKIMENVQEELGVYFKDLFISFLSQTLKRGNLPIYEFSDVSRLKGKKVVLYGAGKVGQDYYAQLCKYEEIEIVAWTDKNYKNFHFDYKRVIGIDTLKAYEIDFWVLAVQDQLTADSMKFELVRAGVQESKIIWKKPGRIAI